MSDLFGIGVPEEWTEEVLNEIKEFHRHRFYLLTKQPQNLAKFSPFPDNCWVGVTACNFEMMDEALLALGDIEAKIKYVSIEPFLDEIPVPYYGFKPELDWIIIGNQLETWKQYERLKNLEYKGLKEASINHGIRIANDLGNAAEMIKVTEEMKEKIGKAMGKEYNTLWDAIYYLKSDVSALLSQKKYAEEIMQLTQLTMNMFQGSFFIENVPAALRKLSDQIEKKWSSE
ncbi:hypothetical protein ES705_50304 [subsurface metagenome]